MTKEEAIQAMKSGEKVTHKAFYDDEYITMKDDSFIINEVGYVAPVDTFWSYRKSEYWNTGWSIYSEK